MADIIQFDFSDVERLAQKLGAAEEQIPFAMALALNQAADNTRNLLIQSTWPAHVQVRNSSFIAASLTTKGARANKRSLAVEIYDRLNRGHLLMHAEGGTRTPHGGSSIAVPVGQVRQARGSRGVPQRLRPKNMPNAVRIKDALYARDKRSHKLRLLYVLKAATRIPKRVPFFEDFARSMTRELITNLPAAVERAMRTARR